MPKHASLWAVGPWSPIQTQINLYFPPQDHPYRILERAILAKVTPQTAVLDIGCGRTAPNLSMLKGKAGNLNGVDLVDFRNEDPELLLHKQNVEAMPAIASTSIDLAYSRSVMEHVQDTEAAMSEIHRVLRPGGRYIFLTPNFYDYASLISYVMPNRLHPIIVRMTEGRAEEDTFPAYYNANTKRRIRQLAAATGFEVERLDYLGQYQNYFAFNRVAFWFGCMYELAIAKMTSLNVLRGWLFCSLRSTNAKSYQGTLVP